MYLPVRDSFPSMKDWSSPEEQAFDAEVFGKVTLVFFGLYVWDMFMTFDFDWSLITGRTVFTWPMGFYLAHRYILLFGMVGIVIALNTTIELNCQALMVFNQFAGDAAVGLASINLSIRTISVWSNNFWIVTPIIFLILGHWALILQVVLLKAAWEPDRGCVIVSTRNQILVAVFLYTIVFDLVVLVLTGWRLAQLGVYPNGDKSGGKESRLGKLVWRDGLIYFLVALASNVVVATFMLLNWNPIMNIMFTIPGTVFSSIAACRAVRRLRRSTESEGVNISQIRVRSSLASTDATAAINSPRPSGVSRMAESGWVQQKGQRRLSEQFEPVQTRLDIDSASMRSGHC